MTIAKTKVKCGKLWTTESRHMCNHHFTRLFVVTIAKHWVNDRGKDLQLLYSSLFSCVGYSAENKRAQKDPADTGHI